MLRNYNGSINWMGAVPMALMAVAIIGFISYEIFRTHLDEGEVTELRYRAAYTTTSFVTVNNVSTPRTTFHPQTWRIMLTNCRDYVDCINDSVSVSEGVFDKTKIGDWYIVRSSK